MTCECLHLIAAFGEIKAAELASLAGILFQRYDRAPVRAEHLLMRGNDNRFPCDLLESRDNSIVECRSALEEYAISDRLLPHDLVEVVSHNRVCQAADQLTGRRPGLLVLDHLRLHEDGAAFSQIQWCFSRQRQLCELFLDADAELLRLLLEKRPGPRRADLVHHEVHYMAVMEADILRVLAADLEDRINRRINRQRAPRMCCNLVLHDIGTDEVAGQIPARPRRTHAANIHNIPDVIADDLEALPHCLNRLPRRHQIDLGEHPPIPVNNHEIRGNRADIYAQICRYRLARRHFRSMYL